MNTTVICNIEIKKSIFGYPSFSEENKIILFYNRNKFGVYNFASKPIYVPGQDLQITLYTSSIFRSNSTVNNFAIKVLL